MTRVVRFAREHRHTSVRRLVDLVADDDDLSACLPRALLERLFDATSQRRLRECLRANVWPDAHRTQFWIHNPLEHFALHLATTRADVHGIRILHDSLEEGAAPERMACNVHSCLARHMYVFTTEEASALCRLLAAIADDEQGRACLVDVELFRGLSMRGRESNDLCATILDVFLRSKVTAVPHALLMAEHSAHRLLSDFANVPRLADEPEEEEGAPVHLWRALRFLEGLAARMEWHAHLSEWVVHLSRYGWPPPFGRLVANMLSTPSVQFVVDMERHGRLALLIRMAHSHVAALRDEAWRIVRGRLRMIWPSRFAAVLNLPDVCKVVAATAYECPITLQPCVHPTVASDGHTYERDALLRLMVETEEARSPVTKARLACVIFENYAVCT